jgi:hypothetical protein
VVGRRARSNPEDPRRSLSRPGLIHDASGRASQADGGRGGDHGGSVPAGGGDSVGGGPACGRRPA